MSLDLTEAQHQDYPTSPQPTPPTAPPTGLRLDLLIDDPETMAALASYPEGRDRNRFARTALRIGIIALKQAQGRIDTESVKNEGERLVREMETRLDDYRRQTEALLTSTLKDYFDPQNGRFNERVERLVRQDGELEQLMRAQVEQAEKSLAETLTRHVGEDSALMQQLSPDESNRFLAALRGHVEETLSTQANAILREFSLDNSEGALARLVRELKEGHGVAAEGLQKRIGEVVQEFSLDNEQSALSRLVRRVEQAQKQINAEFSLDDQNSALARMKRELTQMIEAQNSAAQQFQTQVVGALEAMRAKKTAEAASTTHGHDFQQAGFEVLQALATQAGDIAEDTGNTTGLLARSKVGDAIVTLGPDNAAAGARIAVEFKEAANYTLKTTLDEIDTARKNRDAGIGPVRPLAPHRAGRPGSPGPLRQRHRRGVGSRRRSQRRLPQGRLHGRQGPGRARPHGKRRTRRRLPGHRQIAQRNPAPGEIPGRHPHLERHDQEQRGQGDRPGGADAEGAGGRAG